MKISRKKFEKMVKEAIDELPEYFLNKTHNVAFIVEDKPSRKQLTMLNIKEGVLLYGLYEGYHQSSRKNIGPVLPDKITIFQNAISETYSTEEEIKKQIKKTIKHEIAHHFGSDEKGAYKAGDRSDL
jgi:predicted Zn-dependent protease with MMP-like domain